MKNISLLVVLLALTSCFSNTKENAKPVVNYASANRTSLSGKSKIVQKPTLIKLGIKPLTLIEARGYMHNLFDALIPDLEKTNITYQMAGNDIILTIQSHILLDDEMNIISSIRPQLDNIIRLLAVNDRNFIEIIGHTSSVGPSYTNLVKSKNMAISVAKYFMDRNIIPERIFMNGMGESQWIADNATREGRLLNHRIEIRISPLI
ncbi:MAG: OmpA family protein [Alphaproteobacteria bacterium]|nr:OmpA family protein [Alphaproteobacteria bacterium]